MAFKDTFHRLRKARGWTQKEVAERVGLSVAQIKKYEKGASAPTLTYLRRIAEAYGVSADELVFDLPSVTAPSRLDADLLGRFEKISELPETDRSAVLFLLDSVIARHRIRAIIEA